MKQLPFVHLHNHSEYSVLDGMCRVNDMVDRAAEYNMSAVALTDHGVMFGVVPFYNACKKRGINPIIGCELYLTPGSRHDKNPSERTRYHLVLLCQNEVGYKNLIRLVSLAHTEGFYYKPRIDKELLAAHSEGLIGLSACLSGEVPKQLLNGNYDKAWEAAGFYSEVFGKDNFYLEMQNHGLEKQLEVNPQLVKLAQRLDLGLVATNDSHYLDHGDAYAHELLLCIQTGKTMSDENRMRFDSKEFYFRSPAEMYELFGELPESLTNTVEIANRCRFELDLETVGGKLPSYPVPEGFTEENYLEKLTLEGLEVKRPGRGEEYGYRLRSEFEVINGMGFPGYFLIVWDFVKKAREMGVEVGPGRGSAAGSLVSYCLGITDVDPIEHGLLFERFLNPERISMPDIDLDFADDQRELVLDYVRGKYGEENVAQLITFSRLGARAVIRDIGRVLEIDLSVVDKTAKMIPFGPKVTITKALESTPELRKAAKEDPEVERLLKYGPKLEGLVRHAGTHAAGVVISDEPLVNLVPMYNENTTMYDGGAVEKVGLLKMDFLGLRNLSVIRDCCAMIRENHGVELYPDDIRIEENDPAAYKLLRDCDTVGIFQLESEVARDVLRKVAPDNFNELVPILALYRPGPLKLGMTEKYIKGKHGEIAITYDHPSLEGILAETYGVMVYQEQVMQVASRLAGYSYGKADILRRAMGKKIRSVLEAHRKEFVAGAVEKEINPKLAQGVFDQIVPFAEYGFNKSHSAAYSVVSYRTAWLKAHYRPEFMAALLSHDLSNEDRIALYISECRRAGIEVLPPCVNQSDLGFRAIQTADGAEIRFGMGAIKNVGHGLVGEIIQERKLGGDFVSMSDLVLRLEKSNVNKRVLESLVKAGALDGMPGNRAQKLAIDPQDDSALDDHKLGQAGFDFFSSSTEDSAPSDNLDEGIPPFSEHERMTFEKEVLGVYLTGHPLTRFEQIIRHFATHSVKEALRLSGGKSIRVAGVITGLSKKLDRNKQRIAFANLEDGVAGIEVAIFSDTYKAHAELIEKDRVLLVIGRTQINRDQTTILAEELVELQDVPKQRADRFHLELLGDGLTNDDLKHFDAILREYPGDLKLFIHLRFPPHEVTLRTGPNHRVSGSVELLNRLGELVGKEHAFFTESVGRTL
ncbi:DNA polymerase III subunit alpha [bacterium]|nr:DNA polymerase III subunit alpha [bacterium]